MQGRECNMFRQSRELLDFPFRSPTDPVAPIDRVSGRQQKQLQKIITFFDRIVSRGNDTVCADKQSALRHVVSEALDFCRPYRLSAAYQLHNVETIDQVMPNLVGEMLDPYDRFPTPPTPVHTLHGSVSQADRVDVRRRQLLVLLVTCHICQTHGMDDKTLMTSLIEKHIELLRGAPDDIRKDVTFGIGSWFRVLLPGKLHSRSPCCQYPFGLMEEFGINQREDNIFSFLPDKLISAEEEEAFANYVRMTSGVRLKTACFQLQGKHGGGPTAVTSELPFVDLPIAQSKLVAQHPNVYVTPLSLAIRIAWPNGFLLLLRHGAMPVLRSHDTHVFNRSRVMEPLDCLVHFIGAYIGSGDIAKLYRRVARTHKTRLKLATIRKQVRLTICWRYICDVIPYLRVRFYDGKEQSLDFAKHMTKVIHKGGYNTVVIYLPEAASYIVQECHIRGAPTLQHLARYVIRDCLRQTYQLPEGIKQLEVPEIMKNYLNIPRVSFRGNNVF